MAVIIPLPSLLLSLFLVIFVANLRNLSLSLSLSFFGHSVKRALGIVARVSWNVHGQRSWHHLSRGNGTDGRGYSLFIIHTSSINAHNMINVPLWPIGWVLVYILMSDHPCFSLTSSVPLHFHRSNYLNGRLHTFKQKDKGQGSI